MVSLEDVRKAQLQLNGVVQETPCLPNLHLSDTYAATIFLKREDLQLVRSYKIRGAFNKISSLSDDEKKQGIVCASAGNHAQGVAYSCHLLNIQGTIYMPATTPKQKVRQVELFGKNNVNIVLQGDTFDDSYAAAMDFCQQNHNVFVHPFDDEKVISGQGTVGLEILEQVREKIDIVLVPVGGGGLISGILSVFSQLSPDTEVIGVEPLGAPAMQVSLKKGKNTQLDEIDKFVDGAAVKRVGDANFEICKQWLSEVILVAEGKVCSTILKLYNEQAMVVEPAGALTIAALDQLVDRIKGKNVVCIVSGSNNDITRTEEIKERSLFYEGLKHYFLIQFPQRPGALKDFVTKVLGENDDITFFQFSKKNNRESGPAVVGIELKTPEDFKAITTNLERLHFQFQYLNEDPDLFTQLIG
ncbi:MAG: threonine ammonia-lyase IlvA [Cryomorphaceae bacterium]|jgi:threonine dehydratase|nr:threonine ammonia-lyase IlvA [Cryomorphaceae bacterium]